MSTPPTHKSYFEFTKEWLMQKCQQFEAAERGRRRKAVTAISRQLASQIHNRIRSDKAEWQPLRWCIRHKVTDAVKALKPTFHPAGFHKFVDLTYPNQRLTLAHSAGDRLRLQATLAFLNHRVDNRLSPRCYGNRPKGTQNCSDRRTAVRRFQRLVWSEGKTWVAKLDVKKFYDTLPHEPVIKALKVFVRDRGCIREIKGYMEWYWKQCWPGHPTPPANPVGLPQGSPVSAVLANIYMTSFDEALMAAGIEHIRFLDDVTIVATSPEQLGAQLEFVMNRIEALGLTLAPKKTFVANLDTGILAGISHVTTVTLPSRGDRLPVHREFDELGVHFYADGRFRARHRTVNRLLSKIRQEIRRDRKSTRSPIMRYLRATAAINRMLGYQVGYRRPGAKRRSQRRAMPKPPAQSDGFSRRVKVQEYTTSSGVDVVIRRYFGFAGQCWINGMRYVQPRQHALLGHSDLTREQMRRIDRTIQRWMSREFREVLRSMRLTQNEKMLLKGRRVRSAAKMFEMAANEPVPKCPGGVP